jgi:hypothetical protein
MPRRNFVMSAAAYHHNQLCFERQQSLELRGMEWEGRLAPMTSWSALLLRGAGAMVLLAAMAIIAV